VPYGKAHTQELDPKDAIAPPFVADLPRKID
jgi:hypothetical protein